MIPYFKFFVEVWFSDLYGYWRTRFSSDLVTLYWLRGLVLSPTGSWLKGLEWHGQVQPTHWALAFGAFAKRE